jgi:hypothetical protein
VAGSVASYKQFGFGPWRVALKEMGVPIGICGLHKRLRPEGLSYRGLSGKDLSLQVPGFLYVREPGLFLGDVSRCLNCKKYNLATKITRNLGTRSFSLFPLNVQRSKHLAQWSLECSFA